MKMGDQEEQKVFMPELLEVRLVSAENRSLQSLTFVKTRPLHMNRVPG